MCHIVMATIAATPIIPITTPTVVPWQREGALSRLWECHLSAEGQQWLAGGVPGRPQTFHISSLPSLFKPLYRKSGVFPCERLKMLIHLSLRC